jgi:hypothetical protein
MKKETARSSTAFRIIRSMMDHIFGKEIYISKHDFYHIYSVYNQEGGKWEPLIVGDMDSFMLLKSILESFVEIKQNKKKYGLK